MKDGAGMEIKSDDNVLVYNSGQLSYNGRILLTANETEPFLFLGKGKETMDMYRGNFDISDYVNERLPLFIKNVIKFANGFLFDLGLNDQVMAKMKATISSGRLELSFATMDSRWNRLWLRIAANKQEKVYGCGEQMSYLNLRGKHFPLWTSEPGVGRNKKTLETFYADTKDRAGGDYYTTNFPEPTFITTEKYYCHTTSYHYADFDFSQDDFFELQYWGIPEKIIFETGDSYKQLVTKLNALLGRQPKLPDWTNNGAILGLQGGTDRVQKIYHKMKDHGVKISGLWCQDWEGTQTTSFGKRNYWEWKYQDKLYPNLPKQIKAWDKEGVKFLSYINPYVVNTSDMFKEADKKGYFAKKQGDDSTYLVDFGEFYCGIVDFTNPKAFDWFKEVIKNNLIKVGCAGWMADFGEYLPVDVELYDHSDPKQAHNKWPMLWAKCNYDALKETGNLGKIAYFMRAGAAGSQKYCVLLWCGDQSVNWSLDDGLASTIPAALSAGLTGCGLDHVDIGGYTSQYGIFRTKELFMRWAEMGSFLPVMRTHEGNRPKENFQVYDDDEAIDHFARCTDIFTDLTPYRNAIVETNAQEGIPVQRPLFMEFENDQKAYDIKYEYMFGPDLLVAPVYEEGKSMWNVYLPQTESWIDLWTGKEYSGGQSYEVPAPLGQTPVFYRKDSKFENLFSKFADKYKLQKSFSAK